MIQQMQTLKACSASRFFCLSSLRRSCLPLLSCLFFYFPGPVCAQLVGTAQLELYTNTSVEFASPQRAREIVSANDRFVQALSRFDLQSRLRTNRAVTARHLTRFAAQQVRAWKTSEVTKVRALLASLAERLAAYKLPFPETVCLIKTTGNEEGNAAYCRQKAIVLPQGFVDLPDDELKSKLIHELFHILSSGNPDWRHCLYQLVGFRPCPPIELPASLRDRKITNPDAPGVDVYIELVVQGELLRAAPLLYSSSPEYDPARGGTFFDDLTFRLLVLSRQSGTWRPALRNGQPRLLAAEDLPDYYRQIGRNTETIFHPEEILANNFTHLIQDTPGLPTPQLIERLRTRLLKAP